MLGFLPTPGDDELLYSVMARYGAMTGRRVGSQLMLDFFGTPVGVTAVDLPNRIDSLVARLPPATPFGRDRLVEEHTLFPYKLRFAPVPFVRSVRNYMAGDAGRRPARIGVMSAAFPVERWMMACKACAREDNRNTGAPTWRRVHQLPGVVICPRHGTALGQTVVRRLDRKGRGALMPLTTEVLGTIRSLDLPKSARDDLHRFALASERLLKASFIPCDIGAVSRRLRDLLRDYRWSRAPSLLRTSAMAEEFAACPAIRRLMSAIKVEWTSGTTATAMNRLLHRDEMPKHPLIVLMMLELAGASLDDLYSPEPPAFPEPRRPAAPGRPRVYVRHDLPCGNPACGRFESSLPGVLVRFERPGASFRAACAACGYAYVWDERRPGSVCVAETGELWDRQLKQVMEGCGNSLRATARALGVSPTMVMRHARRLGLWQVKWKDRPKVQLRQETRGSRLLEKHREGWIAYRTSGGSAPAKAMPREAFNAYRYLARKDREWLAVNHPLVRRGRPNLQVC